jgi:hypothetical protein
MSAAIRSTAAWADSSGISSRRVASTSIEAARVMRGERSSWLTSDAKRPSRSMRSSSAWAMWLNDVTSASRSGSSPPSKRVSSRPPAIASAATPTFDRGRSVRRLIQYPSAAPASVVTRDAPNSDTASDSSVLSTSPRGTIS